MKPLLKNMLPAEYQVLWNLTKKQRLNGELGNILQNQIKTVRNNLRSNKTDILEVKKQQFGEATGMWGENKIRELSKIVYQDKCPNVENLGNWISVEIECIMPSERAEVDFVRFIRKYKLTKQVTIKNDHSLRVVSPRHGRQQEGEIDTSGANSQPETQQTAYGREIVITFQYGNWKFVSMVCKKLNELKCYVNQSCGLHVHFDCRHLNEREVTKLGQRVARTIPALKQILPASRQDNRFCAVDINRLQNEDRYAFVNLQAYNKHRTLEIRGHSGTTDPTKIVNWIRILKKIMDKRSAKSVRSLTELINIFKFDADLIEYVNMRYGKFHPIIPTPTQDCDDVEIDNIQQVTENPSIMESIAIQITSNGEMTQENQVPINPAEIVVPGSWYQPEEQVLIGIGMEDSINLHAYQRETVVRVQNLQIQQPMMINPRVDEDENSNDY